MEEVKTGTEFEYSKEIGAIIDSDGEKGIVFYTEDINPEVIEAVVELWNDGTSVIEIVAKLAKRFDDICTSEEREYIQTQIENWEKVSGSALVEKVQKALDNNDIDKVQDLLQKEGGRLHAVTEDGAHIVVQAPTEKKELSRGEKAAATRKANSAGKVSTGSGKKVDSATVVASIKEQIEKGNRLLQCIAYIDSSICLPDSIPSDLEKSERDILLQYAKELESVQSTYLQKIQAI